MLYLCCNLAAFSLSLIHNPWFDIFVISHPIQKSFMFDKFAFIYLFLYLYALCTIHILTTVKTNIYHWHLICLLLATFKLPQTRVSIHFLFISLATAPFILSLRFHYRCFHGSSNKKTKKITHIIEMAMFERFYFNGFW